MNHEIVGPEMKVAVGQLRMPKGEAIARHLAQYSTPSMFVSENTHNSKPDPELKVKRLLVDHELMIHFLLSNNSEMALNVGFNSEKIKINHPELFKAMESLMNQKLESGDRLWDGFHAVLKEIKPR